MHEELLFCESFVNLARLYGQSMPIRAKAVARSAGNNWPTSPVNLHRSSQSAQNIGDAANRVEALQLPQVN